jgi:16S rRNA processing protein RimM
MSQPHKPNRRTTGAGAGRPPARPKSQQRSNTAPTSSKPRPPRPNPKTVNVDNPSQEPRAAIGPTPKVEPVLPENLEYIIIAEVATPFGLRGAVKANILTDFPERFDDLAEAFLAPPGAPLDGPRTRYEVISARVQSEKQVVIRFGGVSKPEQAELLRGYTVAVPLANLVELPAGEYYIFQLIGLEVHTTLGGYLGKLVNVETNPANDLYVVRGPISKKDILIPAIKDVVKDIDIKAGRITIELIEGLLDL